MGSKVIVNFQTSRETRSWDPKQRMFIVQQTCWSVHLPGPSRTPQEECGWPAIPDTWWSCLAGQATSFCWDLSWVRLALVSRCSLWPSTQSSGGDAALPPPFGSGAQGLFHSSVSFLGLPSRPLPRERTGADQRVLCCSSGPALQSASLSLSVPPCPSLPQAWWSPGAWSLPVRVRPARLVLSRCWPTEAGQGSVAARLRGVPMGRLRPVLPLAQDPAAPNRATPSGALGAGLYFVFVFEAFLT